MDFLQQLLLKAKASGRQGRASQPPAASASVAAPGAPAWRGSGKSADESLPPSVEYDFSTDTAGVRLREQWAAFEEVYADMGLSLEEKLAAFRPFCQAFVDAHQHRGPDMWRMGEAEAAADDDDEELEPGDDQAAACAAEAAAPTPHVVPASTEGAPGHSKVVVVIISTLFMDAWARGGLDVEGPEPPLLSERDCPTHEQAWLHNDTHDLLACYRTLVAVTTPTPPGEQERQRRRRRRRDLVRVLEAMAQLAKLRHDRRLLLHSLGDGLPHFLASLLLALGRRLGELSGGVETEEGKEALAFLLACLLLAVQVFAHSVPALPHYCRLLKRRTGRQQRLVLPPHPWSGPRMAALAKREAAVVSQHGNEEDDDDGGGLERSMRGLAVQESWSLLALQEGVLPSVLEALRVSLRVAAAVAARGGGVYEARSEDNNDDSGGSHPLLDTTGAGLDIWRLLVALQCEALFAAGAALAAHPHEAIAALNGMGDTALLTESLTAALALDGAADDGHLWLAWARAECALALLQECLPVVQATLRVQGRMAQQAREGNGGGFSRGSSSGSGGGRRAADVEVGSSTSSSLTVHDLGAVVLEGLMRGVPRIEQLLGRASSAVASSGDASSTFQLEAPATTQPPVETTHYDLYPWPTPDEQQQPPPQQPPPPPPPPAVIERQGSRVARLSLRRSLSASSVLLRLEDVIDAARPLLHDARATYRLLLDGPLLLAAAGGDGEEGADGMYTSAFAHLLALCDPAAEQGQEPPQPPTQQQPQPPPQQQHEHDQPSMLSVALHIVQRLLQPPPSPHAFPALARHVIAFLARCLLLSPLETIAGCRHLGLWPLLLAAVGLPSSPSYPSATAQTPLLTAEAGAGNADGMDSGASVVVRVRGSAGAAAWLRAQDQCLELLHWAFMAAQHPPTTNFLSSPTMEMGLIAGLLESAVAALGLEEGAPPQQQSTDSSRSTRVLLLAFRACRWLDLIIREQDDPAPTALAAGPSSASVPAFNEHGHRLLALLPRLLALLNSTNTISISSTPLLWPVRHAALSLFASLAHVASLVESQLALTAWAADALFGLAPIGTAAEGAEAAGAAATTRARPLDPVFDAIPHRASRPVALFVVTRALHTAAQLALAAAAAGRPLDTQALGLYREYLQRWRAHAMDGAPAAAAAVDMARALCAMLREQEAYSAPVVRFHQRALRRAGAFALVAKVLEAGAPPPGLVNQCLALLTALASDSPANRAALDTAFLEQEPPALLRLLLLRPAAIAEGGDTVRALFDLAVGGPFVGAAGGDTDKGGGGSIVVRSLGAVTLLFRLLPHLSPGLQVSVFRMLRALVSRGVGGSGHQQQQQPHDGGARGPSPSELNSEVHCVLLPLLLDAVEALPPCSAPQNAAIDLLAEIGAVHMTVPHLHRLLRMLQPRTDGNDDADATAVARRPANLSRLLRCLDRMVEEERFAGPSHYLWLDGGPQSGLRLRPLAGFSRRHYSFVTWVCLEAGVADPSSSYRPYLFSLVAEDGTALDAYFAPTGGGSGGGGGGGGGQQGHYALQLEYRRNKASPAFVEWSDTGAGGAAGENDAPTIVVGRWSFIAVSHRAPAGFRAAADVTVLVDGACFKGNLPYPSLKSLSTRSHIGGRHDPSAAAPAGGGGGVAWGTGLRGRVGAVYLLDEYMKEEQLRALRARGPDYRGFGGGEGLLDPAWEGSLLPHNRVMLLVHPAQFPCHHYHGADAEDAAATAMDEGGGAVGFESAWDWRGRPALEMVREQQQGRLQPQHPVVLGRGAVAVARTRIVDVLECVGGAKVFLPLFAQLDLPSEEATAAAAEEEDLGDEEEQEDAVRLLDLLGKCLAQSPPGSATLALFHVSSSSAADGEPATDAVADDDSDDEDGALLLAHLLGRLQSRHFTPALLAAAQRLLSRALLLPPTAPAIAPNTAPAALALRLLGGDGGAGLRAWRDGAAWETQQEALALLLLYLQPASSRVAPPLARRTDPGRLLDALRRLYSYEAPAAAEAEQLAATRRALLDVVATVVAVRATDAAAAVTAAEREEDVVALVDAVAAQALVDAGDGGRGACELLRLLLRLLPQLPGLAAHLLSVPGSPAYLLLHLAGDAGRQPLAVRLLAFRVLVAACALAPRQWQEERRRRPQSLGKRSGMALLRSSLSSVGVVRGFVGEAMAGEDGEKDGFLLVRPEMTCVEAGAAEEAQEEQLREALFWGTWRLLGSCREGGGGGQRLAVAAVAARWLADAMAAPGVVPARRSVPVALRAAGALPAWWFEDEDEDEDNEGEERAADAAVEAAMAALSITDAEGAGIGFRSAISAFVYAARASEAASTATSSIDAAAEATYGLKELEERVASALEGSAEHQAAWLALLERRRAGGEERLRAAEAAAQEERVWVWHHRWQRLLDAVAGERGVWGPGRARLRQYGGEGAGLAGVGPAGISWMLDDVEDRWRCRRKLVRRRRPGFVLPGAIGDEAARLRHADASARMRGGGGAAAVVAAAATGGEGGEGGTRLAPAIERLVSEGEGRVERSNSREELWKDLVKYQRREGEGVAEDEDEDDVELEEGIDEEALSGAADAQEGEGRETPVPTAAAGTAATASSPPPKALQQASPTKLATVTATPTRPLSLALGERRRPGSASLVFPAGMARLQAGGRSSVPLIASVSPRVLSLPGEGGSAAAGMMGTGGLTLARLLSTAAGGGATAIPLAAGVKEARACEVIRPFVVSPGLFEVHKAALRFTLQDGAAAPVPPEDPTAWCLQPFPSTLWRLEELRAMYLRLYQQQPTAVEFFFADQTSLFVNFHARPAAVAVYKAVRKLAPRGLEPHLGSRPTKVWQRMRTAGGSHLTQAWQRREISNFEYLSYLNLVAGRTYHDLSQYPIFPWVIADYTSPTLDLNDPQSYRDLRWPMGAQRPEARPALQETYRTLEEDYLLQQQQQQGGGGVDDELQGAPPLPPFHHGSHYSTAAFVLWYLLRLEPFASLHVHLQGGRFDHPDRQLRSLAAAYDGCTRNPSDVKELVPEAFYLPDFLANANALALGATQRGEALGDVALPPWAGGSPEAFVRLHRAALESEYVSAHLHHWVDLVFGFRQRPPHLTAGGKGSKAGKGGGGGDGGQAAVKACNVFFHLTYHGALDLEALKRNDPLLYESTLKQIQDFGQTPLQLFAAPHPPRTPLHKATDLVWPLASAVPGAGTTYVGDDGEGRPAVVSKPERLLSFPPVALSAAGPLLVIAETAAADRIVTVDGVGGVLAHAWSVQNPDAVPPFKLRPDVGGADGGLLGSAAAATGPQELALDADAQLLFTCGYLDGSFKITALDYEGPGGDGTGGGGGAGGGSSSKGGAEGGAGGGDVRHRLLQSVAQHQGVVRCLALGRAKGALHHHGPYRHHAGSGAAAISAAAAGLQGASVNLGGVGGGVVGGSGGGVGTGAAGGCASGRAYLATGGDDCTVRVWVVACRSALPAVAFEAGGEGWHPSPGSLPVHPRPLHVLTGHDAPVLCLAVDVELDLVVSGGADGRVLVHSLREGRYIRTLGLGEGEAGAIHWVGIAQSGYFLSYSRDVGLLRSHGLSSGRPCGRLELGEGDAAALHAFCLSEDGQVLLTGGADRRVTLRWCHSLALADDGPRAGMGAMTVLDGSCESMAPRVPSFSSAVRSLALTAGERLLLVGLEAGEMYILAPDAAYLRSRLKKRLETLGFF